MAFRVVNPGGSCCCGGSQNCGTCSECGRFPSAWNVPAIVLDPATCSFPAAILTPFIQPGANCHWIVQYTPGAKAELYFVNTGNPFSTGWRLDIYVLSSDGVNYLLAARWFLNQTDWQCCGQNTMLNTGQGGSPQCNFGQGPTSLTLTAADCSCGSCTQCPPCSAPCVNWAKAVQVLTAGILPDCQGLQNNFGARSPLACGNSSFCGWGEASGGGDGFQIFYDQLNEQFLLDIWNCASCGGSANYVLPLSSFNCCGINTFTLVGAGAHNRSNCENRLLTGAPPTLQVKLAAPCDCSSPCHCPVQQYGISPSGFGGFGLCGDQTHYLCRNFNGNFTLTSTGSCFWNSPSILFCQSQGISGMWQLQEDPTSGNTFLVAATGIPGVYARWGKPTAQWDCSNPNDVTLGTNTLPCTGVPNTITVTRIS